MAVINKFVFINHEFGSSMTEVVLSLAIIAMATPFLYGQMQRANDTVRDVSVANQIVSSRDNVLNFIRLNQESWPDVAQINLSSDDLKNMSSDAVAGFIDKYKVNGLSVTDVYLAFDIDNNYVRANKIARRIGDAAAVVMTDGIVYGNTWAVAVPNFEPGYLVYKISRDVSEIDSSRYLHRTASGDLNLNVMQRDLNMSGHNIENVGKIEAQSVRGKGVITTFVETDELVAGAVHFSSGANLEGGNAQFENIRVSGDVSGFRNIYADNMNGVTYTTLGRIIADRANVSETLNVAKDFVVKSDYVRTISGFSGIKANRVAVPFLRTEQLLFFENFGLTVSGELLNSATAPLKIGTWVYPSTSLPNFHSITFSRTEIPTVPQKDEFYIIMGDNWQSFQPEKLQ
ncbi:MAG: hypothetical protein MJ187_01060 [Alphaproteobacteria bacterium]|nr:hypothetical protein [Alphaproteobacteria bacterium]